MARNIDWNNIKDGFQGFEKLAVAYIQHRYSNIDWKKTAQTHDGNTDAIAIIMGYQSQKNRPVQWWMEAKYSPTVKQLTRYRIDSTVVSAILEGNIEKVAFITNIEVDAKVISDITKALYVSSCCKEVEFYTKYSLEYWLLAHPDKYNLFFANEDNQVPTLSDDFIISQGIKFYNSLSDSMTFNEAQRELIVGKEYYAYFGVFASKDTEISISTSSNLKGIKLLSNVKGMIIHAGENTVRFRFALKDNYGYKHSKRTDLPSPAFKIGNVKLLPHQRISVLKHNEAFLNLGSQEAILKCLRNKYAQFEDNSLSSIISICGKTGVGKTMILDMFLGEHTINKNISFYQEFTESIKENVQILLNLLIYILFPYIPPETIDESYIDKVANIDVKNLLRDFLRYKNDHENVLIYIARLLQRPSLLPSKMSIGRRTIVLDHIHMMDEKSALFISRLICEINKKKLPVFIILCGQPECLDTVPYKYLKEHCMVDELKLELDGEDILSNCSITCAEKSDLAKLDIFDVNATFLLIFHRYLTEGNKVISTFQDLIVALRTFWISSFSKRHILECFKTIFSLNSSYRLILDKIYWSCQPVAISELSDYESELHYLLESDLIKYNSKQNIVSNNPIYQSVYRENFLPLENNLCYKPGSPEDLRIKFLSAVNVQTLKDCINKVKSLFEMKSYYVINYILKDVFND